MSTDSKISGVFFEFNKFFQQGRIHKENPQQICFFIATVAKPLAQTENFIVMNKYPKNLQPRMRNKFMRRLSHMQLGKADIHKNKIIIIGEIINIPLNRRKTQRCFPSNSSSMTLF